MGADNRLCDDRYLDCAIHPLFACLPQPTLLQYISMQWYGVDCTYLPTVDLYVFDPICHFEVGEALLSI